MDGEQDPQPPADEVEPKIETEQEGQDMNKPQTPPMEDQQEEQSPEDGGEEELQAEG